MSTDTEVAPDRDPATYSPLERFAASIPPEERAAAIRVFVRELPAHTRDGLRTAWYSWWARPNQLMPLDETWQTWLIRAGRGYGKTRTGAEGVRRLIKRGMASRVSLIAPTAGDGRDVMVEGESGLLAIHPNDWRPEYEPSKRRLTWPNGAQATVFSAEEPDRLRGPQSDLVWGDEPASWKTGSAAWDMAAFGNRLGAHPRAILTGTPRPLPWLKEIEAKPSTRVTTGSTYENLTNLAPSFVDMVLERYEGTRLGRQELHALYLEDTEGALWTLEVLNLFRMPTFERGDPWRSLKLSLLRAGQRLPQGDTSRPWVTYVAVDPPGSTAECGIAVGTAPKGGRAGYDHAVILDDMSIAGSPPQWGAQVVAAYRKYGADCVYVEANQGGDMVVSTIHNIDETVNVEKIHAKESKYDRAEPISTLTAKGWIHFNGILSKLEDQMTTWVPGPKSKSPDRMDAFVHLVTKLLKPMQTGRAGTVQSPVGYRIPQAKPGSLFG